MSCQEIAPLLQPSAALMLVLHKKPLDFPVMTECKGPHYCKHQSIKLHDFELFSINYILRGSINLNRHLKIKFQLHIIREKKLILMCVTECYSEYCCLSCLCCHQWAWRGYNTLSWPQVWACLQLSH